MRCAAGAQGSEALAELVAAAIAQAALDHDDRSRFTPSAGRSIEENLWRAIRHGLDRANDQPRGPRGVLGGGAARPAACLDRARARGVEIEPQLPAQNGAQRQRRALLAGDPIDEIYSAELYDT